MTNQENYSSKLLVQNRAWDIYCSPPPKEIPTEEEKREGGRKYLGRKLIQLRAKGLTPTQKNWSILKMELLGVIWALEHSKYYSLGASNINVRTDHAPLKGFLNEELSKLEIPE